MKPPLCTVETVLSDEGQSRRSVAEGPTIVLVEVGVCRGVCVGAVEVGRAGEEDVDPPFAAAAVPVAAEVEAGGASVEFFFDIVAPTPPPMAAPRTTIMAITRRIQNTRGRRPHIVFFLSLWEVAHAGSFS